MSRGKERYKSAFLVRQLLVFLAPARIGWSRSRILVPRWSCELQAHNDLSWFRPLLGGNSIMSIGLILKINMCYKGVSRELKKFAW
jgi:hypothetical protein